MPVRAYRLDRAYIKRYLTVTVILTLAEISSFYIARTSALYLLLPLAIGYFLYVSAGNLVTAAMTAYFVTDDGVYQRIPGGATHSSQSTQKHPLCIFPTVKSSHGGCIQTRKTC